MANGFKIEDNVLLGCSKSAVKVTIPDGVERLEERAFKGCTLLETIEIPATVSKLDIEFSRDCDALISVKISEGVKEIWSSIFAGCEKLTSLEYMGTMAQFNAIKGASKVWIENTLPEITCSDGIIPRPVFIIDEGNLYFCDKTRIAANLEIPSGVIKIGKSAFEGIETLKSVKMCTGLKEIGYNAFSKCTSLETVEFSDGVEIIGICAFAGCTALRSIDLPASLKWITSSAFQGCNLLTTVHYAGSLEQWEKVQGKEKFWGDIPASEVICSDGSASRPLLLIEDGVLKACTDKLITTVSIPEGINEIGEYAFQNCEKLEAVEIPQGVTKVSYCAFDACKALKSVTFPEGLKEIRAQAFQHCESLTAIEIPESVEKVYSGAFNWCKSLRIIKLPSNWEKIDAFIFETLPSDYEILCQEGSVTFTAAKKSSKLKTHVKASS